MKNSQKWLLISILIFPAIILTFFLIISGINIKDLSWWTIIIPLLILISPFTFLLAQRFAQRKIYDAPLHKKKFFFIIIFGIDFIFLAIIILLEYYNVIYPFTWIPLSAMILTPVFFIIFGNFRLFFPKKSNEK